MANVYKGREREYLREWRVANRERHRAKQAAWRAANAEKVRAYRKKWNEENPGKQKQARNAWRRDWRRRKHVAYYEKFGLALEFLEEMLAGQGGGCAICHTALDFAVGRKDHRCPHVDHCHTSGAIRGVLCRRCNQQLGHYETWPEFSLHAAEYLERPRAP